jgi:hypothetical protein
MTQLQHAWGSLAIKPEELASEMKAKLKIIFMIFILKNRREENL